MLTLRCADCKAKLWKYQKYGQGEVLRCHKQRISKMISSVEKDGRIYCTCGNDVGIDKGTFYKMIPRSFTYSGKKVNK